MAVGRFAAELHADSTPTFYSSSKLVVTGMKVKSGSTVYPISAVTTVEILRRRIGFLFQGLKLAAVSIIASFFVLGMPALGVPSGSLMPIMGFLMFVMALLVLVLSIFIYAFERTVHICPVSGNGLRIKVYDMKTAMEMRAAVDRAMTFHANAAAGVPTVAEELGSLAALRSQGAISESDWESAKDLFLGKRPDAQQQAAEQLRQLYDLHRTGVLSESEFNMKKWDILSRNQSQSA